MISRTPQFQFWLNLGPDLALSWGQVGNQKASQDDQDPPKSHEKVRGTPNLNPWRSSQLARFWMDLGPMLGQCLADVGPRLRLCGVRFATVSLLVFLRFLLLHCVAFLLFLRCFERPISPVNPDSPCSPCSPDSPDWCKKSRQSILFR